VPHDDSKHVLQLKPCRHRTARLKRRSVKCACPRKTTQMKRRTCVALTTVTAAAVGAAVAPPARVGRNVGGVAAATQTV